MVSKRHILFFVTITICYTTGQNDQEEFIEAVFQDCTCVPYYQCINGTRNKGGNHIIGIRKQNSDCTGIDTCCPNEHVDKSYAKPVITTEQQFSGHTADPQIVCECVLYYQCHKGMAIKDGTGLFNIRQQEEMNCKNKTLTMCCHVQKENIRSPSLPPPKITKIPPKECGQRSNGNGLGYRITAGLDASIQEFPWMVAVFEDETSKYICGGALIHPQVVLTGGHCSAKVKGRPLKVRVATSDIEVHAGQSHQERKVIRIITHPKHNGESLYYNVALYVLDAEVDLNENVGLICLPPANHRTPDFSRCLVSGWGTYAEDDTKDFSHTLKQIEVPIVPHDDCEKSLKATRLGDAFELHETFICAGGEEGKDACTGDGGSPLVCPIRGTHRYFELGIVSWGIGCGGTVPGVYGDVTKFRTWIDEQMHANRFQIRYNY